MGGPFTPPNAISPSGTTASNPASAGFDSFAGIQANANAADFVQKFTDAVAAVSILVPEGVTQIGAFAFDYQENNEVDLENEIPDHQMEDNTFSNDHIAVKPDRVILSGYVVELTMPAATIKTVLGALTAATNLLSALPVFLGAQTPGGAQAIAAAISQAQSVIVQVEQAVARAAQIANLLNGFLNGQAMTKQQAAFKQLRALRDAGIIFTVYSSFQVHDNMAIESLRVIQPPDSQGWARFVVRMKKMNVIGASGTPHYLANLSSPVASAQGQAGTNVGATAGTPLAAGATASSTLSVPAVP